MNKWKEKNIQEDIEEISTPVFSLKNFNKDPEEVEYEHLLSLIKDPLDRRWILASIDERLPIKKKIKQLEQFIQYLKEGQELMNEDLIQNQVLDLDQKIFNESFLRTFRMDDRKTSSKNVWPDGSSLPVSIKGSPDQIQALSSVLQKEKEYIHAFKTLPHDHPELARKKSTVEKMVKDFTRKTRASNGLGNSEP